MTRTFLPQRPFVELAPPPDGLDQVRHSARGRRRRRALGVTAGGAVTVAVAVAVALMGGGSNLAVLKPVPPALQPSPTPQFPGPMDFPGQAHPRQGSIQTGVPSHVVTPMRQRQGTGAGSGGDVPASAPVVGGGGHNRTAHESRFIPLRVFRSTIDPNSKNICTGSASSDGSTVSTEGLGWCLFASASPTSGGVELLVQVCRDDTGGATLDYSGTREVDLNVRQGGRTVWSWSATHPDSPDAHQRSLPARGCWNWQLLWPDVSTSGASAGHGSFTFVGGSTARELAGQQEQSAQFRY